MEPVNESTSGSLKWLVLPTLAAEIVLQLRTMHLLRLQLRPEALAGDADAQICHCLEGRSPP